MQENRAGRFRECAMRDGTYLGLLWIVTFATSILMFKSMDSSYGLIIWPFALSLMMLSPVLVYKSAKRYRDKECQGTVPYSEAWLYMLLMYACAIVLSSIAQYIFYAYIDPYMFATAAAEIENLAATGIIDSESANILSGMLEEMERMSAGEIVFSQIGGHVSRDIMITSLLALSIRKTTENKI